MKSGLLVVAATAAIHSAAAAQPASPQALHLLCTGSSFKQGKGARPTPWEQVVTIDPTSGWMSWQQFKLSITTTPTNYTMSQHQGIRGHGGVLSVNVERTTGSFEARFTWTKTGADYWWIKATCVPSTTPVIKF